MQPDLLDWVPPGDGAPAGAILIAFPLSRDMGRIRHVARLALAKDDRARDSYWRQVSKKLAGSLERSGFPRAEIERQIESFRIGVVRELTRFERSDRKRPGGAS